MSVKRRTSKPRLTTTQRGLGWDYQQQRKAAYARLRNGEPCWRCGRPMFKWQRLEYDHVIPRAFGGGNGEKRFAHQSCNRRAGQQITAAILRARHRAERGGGRSGW